MEAEVEAEVEVEAGQEASLSCGEQAAGLILGKPQLGPQRRHSWLQVGCANYVPISPPRKYQLMKMPAEPRTRPVLPEQASEAPRRGTVLYTVRHGTVFGRHRWTS